MLKTLTVQNYALIQQLSIDFESGFSTLTGETGAGKSILLGALSLVLGNRADTTMLNNTNEKCVVEATFNIKSYALEAFFKQYDLDYDADTIIRREILPNGKSRAFINDTPANLSVLKELSAYLIDVHSQHENLELHNSKFQLQVIDALAKNQQLLIEYQKVYKQFKQQEKDLNTLITQSNTAEADYDFNLFQYKQLAEIHLETLNQEALENELELLNHAEDVQLNLHTGFSLLSESENNSIDLLKQAKQAFEKIKEFYPDAANYTDRLESIIIDLKDIVAEIEQAAENIAYNPEKASELKEQLDKIYSLQQKHRVDTIAGLIETRDSFDKKIQAKENFVQDIEKLEKQLQETRMHLEKLAMQLSKKRKKASPELSKQIVKQLADLGMPYATFNAEITSNGSYTPFGKDSIGFLFSANKNQPTANIAKIASGGEISRLMLSIKSILSESIALPTIIFDEIDTGVSGEIADKMADIMKNMAKTMQVISITHLPQIAARGMNQYKVYKNENEHKVITQINKLSANERIEEIARMLSGKDVSKEAIENAKTLISS